MRPERRYYQGVTTSTAASPTSRCTRAFAPHLAAFIQDVVRKTPSSRSAHDGILRSSPPTPGNPELQYPIIAKLNEPRLIGRAAHLGDLQSFAASLAKSGVAAVGPAPGSRRRPDGRVLQWKALTLKENAAFLLPFFIQWCADSIHPSADSPKGCSLLRFEAVSPETESLSRQVALLNIDMPVVKSDNPQLRATIGGPRAQFTVTS
jgi:hypothetical protein